MHKAQHNERPTDIVHTSTLREEATRASLRRNLKNLTHHQSIALDGSPRTLVLRTGVKFYLSAM